MNRRELLTGALAAAAAPLLPKELAASELIPYPEPSPVLADLAAWPEWAVDPPIYRGPFLYAWPDMKEAFLRAGYPAYMMRDCGPIPTTGDSLNEID